MFLFGSGALIPLNAVLDIGASEGSFCWSVALLIRLALVGSVSLVMSLVHEMLLGALELRRPGAGTLFGGRGGEGERSCTPGNSSADGENKKHTFA